MKKLLTLDLIKINQQAQRYFYPGYNIYFLHGWFCAYLSAPSDSEEDLVIPSYLVLDETKITQEKQFTRFIDELMSLYTLIANNIYEANKLLKPLINLNNLNACTSANLSQDEQINLLHWLYGYLCGYLVIGTDITEYCNDEKLLNDKFFPALYTICTIFLGLDQLLKMNNYLTGKVLADYLEVKQDIIDMWEEENGLTILESAKTVTIKDITQNLILALNDVFYVIRSADEIRFADNLPPQLLNKLTNSLQKS